MKKILTLLLCSMFALSACGNDEEQTENNSVANNEAKNKVVKAEPNPQADVLNEKWKKVIGNRKLFKAQYDKLSAAQQYYFCSAFSLSAMSASKPVTASAMISYFLGVGVEKYSQGIDDNTYYAFDMGKNIFLYDDVVNYVIENGTCEKVISEATDYVKDKNLDTEDMSKKGNRELKKIVERISNENKK